MGVSKEAAYIPPFVRELMSGASEEELLAATENLKAYLRALYALSQSIEIDESADSSTLAPHGRFNDTGVVPPTT